MATPQFPADFKCPISLEIMTDPVILSSGHTFDRSSIRRWLDSGNRTCPITKQLLPQNPSLIPNHALRSLISNFSFTCSSSSQSKSLPQEPDPQTLISNLTCRSSTPLHSKIYSLDQLNRLCKSNPFFRQKLTESGAVSTVLNFVGSEDSRLQESALLLLLNLSLDDDNKVGLVAEGAIGRVISALRFGNPSCKAYAATMLTSLAMVEVNKGTIGAYPFAVDTLVSLLREGKVRERKEAATALYVLSSFPDNKKKAVECGAIPILIEMVNTGMERAIEIMGLLAKCKEGREEMGKIDECVRVLIQVLKEGSSRSIICALAVLNSLCCHSEEISLEVWRKGVLEICLGLAEDDNDKISRNASNLVQTLRRCLSIA